MNYKDKYIEKLEKLVTTQLLPIYNKYYEEHNMPIPDIDVDILTNIKKKPLPKLLRGF